MSSAASAASTAPSPPVFDARGICKSIGAHSILRDISLTIEPQERVAIVGPSGSGKSTLIAILGLLTPWASGTLHILGAPVSGAKPRPANHPARVGWIPQLPIFLPGRSVMANLLVAQELKLGHQDQALAEAVLDEVRLADKAQHDSSVLSGGELQRLAVARALVMQPHVILADEPTGALDSTNSVAVVDALVEVANAAVVIVTHDHVVADRCPRVLRLHDGSLVP